MVWGGFSVQVSFQAEPRKTEKKVSWVTDFFTELWLNPVISVANGKTQEVDER